MNCRPPWSRLARAGRTFQAADSEVDLCDASWELSSPGLLLTIPIPPFPLPVSTSAHPHPPDSINTLLYGTSKTSSISFY